MLNWIETRESYSLQGRMRNAQERTWIGPTRSDTRAHFKKELSSQKRKPTEASEVHRPIVSVDAVSTRTDDGLEDTGSTGP